MYHTPVDRASGPVAQFCFADRGNGPREVARPAGLEPATLGLEGRSPAD